MIENIVLAAISVVITTLCVRYIWNVYNVKNETTFTVYAVWYESPLHHTGIMTESTDGVRNYYDFDHIDGIRGEIRESKNENSVYKKIHSKLEILKNIDISKRKEIENTIICRKIARYDMGLNSCRVHVALVTISLVPSANIKTRRQVANFLQNASENTFEYILNSAPGKIFAFMLRAASGESGKASLESILKKKHLFSFNAILIDGYVESDLDGLSLGNNPETP